MDLWILSQDKEMLCKAEDGNTQIEHIQRNCVVFEMPEE